MARNASDPLDLKNTQWRDYLPLGDSLRRDSERLSQSGKPAYRSDRALQSFPRIAHKRMKARLVIKIKPPLVADRKEMLYPIDMSLGKRIKKSRKALGMTQAELGKFLGISGQAVSQWETGETTPETEKLGQLAHTLRVSVDWLLRPSKAEQDAA